MKEKQWRRNIDAQSSGCNMSSVRFIKSSARYLTASTISVVFEKYCFKCYASQQNAYVLLYLNPTKRL